MGKAAEFYIPKIPKMHLSKTFDGKLISAVERHDLKNYDTERSKSSLDWNSIDLGERSLSLANSHANCNQAK